MTEQGTVVRLYRAAVAIAVAALYGCTPSQPVYAPPIPILNLTEAERAFRNPLYRTIDPKSFEKALIRTPSARGTGGIYVPVGGYLSARLVNALPDDRRISLIRLDRFNSMCGGVTFYLSNGVRCSIDVAMTVMVGGEEREVSFGGEREIGPVLVPGNLSQPFGSSQDANIAALRKLHAQARMVADTAAAGAAREIREVLGTP